MISRFIIKPNSFYRDEQILTGGASQSAFTCNRGSYDVRCDTGASVEAIVGMVPYVIKPAFRLTRRRLQNMESKIGLLCLGLGCITAANAPNAYAEERPKVSIGETSHQAKDGDGSDGDGRSAQFSRCGDKPQTIHGESNPHEVENIVRHDAATICSNPTSENSNDIVIFKEKLRGSVSGNISPEFVLNESDLAVYGASNIEDLLDIINSRLKGIRDNESDSPVILMNGIRISGLAEVANIPIEAIERMEIYPPELGLRFGYRPDQKVVNFVTYEKFHSHVVKISSSAATDGGYFRNNIIGNYFRIRGSTRANIELDINKAGFLTWDERHIGVSYNNNISQRFQTLLPKERHQNLRATLSGSICDGISSSIAARYGSSTKEYKFYELDLSYINQSQISHNFSLTTTHSGQIDNLLWTINARYDYSDFEIDRYNDENFFTGSHSRAVDNKFSADLLINDNILQLPAGILRGNLL